MSVKWEEKPCECGNHYIVNRTYWLCDDCNYIRIHGKTKFEAHLDRLKHKNEQLYQKETKSFKSSKKVLKNEKVEKRRKIIERDEKLYEYIFYNKIPVCEECALHGIITPLPNKFRDEGGKVIARWQYSHILPKSVYPEFRWHILNINRLCLDHHQQWDHGDREAMLIFLPNQKLIEKIKQTPLDLI